jgi:selenocysteine lyase/cysteine desulfurase
VNRRSGILTFRHPTIPTDRFFEALVKNDAVVSLRFDRDDRDWLRVSPHFYNTFDEIAKVADVLRREA